MTVLVVSLMAITLIWQDIGDFHSFLRISRECLILILLILFNQRVTASRTSNEIRKIERSLLVVILIEFLIAVIQLIFLQRGIWVGPSANWLAGRGDLIPSILDLRYSKLRPSGTFSEPSYLGIFCISILILASSRPNWSKITRITYLLCIATIIICQSKLALFFCIAILFVKRKRNQRALERKISTFVFPGLFFLVLPFVGLIAKTLQSSRGSVSIQNRIIEPFNYTLNFIIKHPFGISFYKRITEFVDLSKGLSWDVISHNSIFNFLFSYGVVGLLITFRILYIGGKDSILLLFLLSLLLQNGAFLDFDKLFIVSVVISIYRYHASGIEVKDEVK